MENILQNKPESNLPSSELNPATNISGEENKIGGRRFSVKGFNSELIKKLSIPYGLLIFLYLSKYLFGDVLFPILFVIFTGIISVRWLKIQTQIKEIRIDTVFKEKSPWHDRLMRWNTLLTIFCLLMAIFTSLSLFIFLFSVGKPYIAVLFLDGLFFLYINEKLRINLKGHLKSKPAILTNDLLVNFLNVVVLFVLYFLYSLLLEHFTVDFEHGVLDPNIPTWVQNNIHHSCYIFEKILRISVAFKLTFENLLSMDHWILLIYKIIHLLTMSFWPFVGITFFYRFFLNEKQLSFTRKFAQ